MEKNKRIVIGGIVLLFSCIFAIFLIKRGGITSVETMKSGQDPVLVSMDKITRKPYDGFEWKVVSGREIAFWAQESEDLQVVINDTLSGVFIVRIENELPVVISKVMQIFDLKNKQIESLLDVLEKSPGWSYTERCKFHKIASNRTGVERYVLQPTGKALEEFKIQGAVEPIPTTCGGWGMGNSGTRYFEIHQNKRDRALFVEIGQEAPLFDEQSIVMKGGER